MGLTLAAQSQQASIDVQVTVSSSCVTYEIRDRANGAVEITVTTSSSLTVRREDLTSHAEACAALQYLRIIVAVLGHDLIQTGGSVVA